MAFLSVNPYTQETLAEVAECSDAALEKALAAAAACAPRWRDTALGERAALLLRIADELSRRRDELALLMTHEMGKLIGEARAEIDKCAWVCRYYAEQGGEFIADEPIESDASRSFVAWQPLGTVLAVMPWNFPFWQVFRFAAPALLAGNTGLLKHASNVPQCAQAIEDVIRAADAPAGLFQSLMIGARRVAGVIADNRVRAVTLTGSEPAGRAVAATAGQHLKKCVLELGGSDPFVVLADADLDLAVQQAVASRYLNAGQSCIAAKRFILTAPVHDEFLGRFTQAVAALKPGDPAVDGTTLAPMARSDLRDDLHRQVSDSIAQGARAVTGCEPGPAPGAFYAASILADVAPGMRAYSEEFFGPVAIVLRAADTAEALRLANDTRFGLGGSVWGRDVVNAEAFARRLECGCAFINGMVKSDPRLPFGGVKDSGFGRELSRLGLREFVNAKTIWQR